MKETNCSIFPDPKGYVHYNYSNLNSFQNVAFCLGKVETLT